MFNVADRKRWSASPYDDPNENPIPINTEPFPSLESLSLQIYRTSYSPSDSAAQKKLQQSLLSMLHTRAGLARRGTVPKLKTLRTNARLLHPDVPTRAGSSASRQLPPGASWYAEQVDAFELLADGDLALWNISRR